MHAKRLNMKNNDIRQRNVWMHIRIYVPGVSLREYRHGRGKYDDVELLSV